MLKTKIKAALFFVVFGIVSALTLLNGTAAYNDVNGHWAQDAIEKWSQEYGILNGYGDGSFAPDSGVTRAELAVIIDRVLDFAYLPKDSFKDVKGNEWFAEAVLNLKAAGVISADSDGNFCPDETVTREEAAKIFSRAFEILRSYDETPYLDSDDISDEMIGYVSGITKSGYMQGADGFFNPTAPLTRAAVVTILDNIVSHIITEATTLSGVIEGSVVIASSEVVTITDCEINGDLYISESVPQNGVYITASHISGGLIDHREETVEIGSDVKISNVGRDYIRLDFYGFEKLETIEKNELDVEKFAKDGEFPLYNGQLLKKGVDVSAWQEEIDWKKVAESGIDFAMIRVGYRGYSYGAIVKDKYFDDNIKGALENGLDVGVYFFSQALTVEEALEEAEYVISVVKDYNITYPIVFDWEFVSDKDARTANATGDMITECAVAFCNAVYDAGYMPMIYTNMTLAYVHLDLDTVYNYPIWLAEYKDAPKYYYTFDMWQFTSKGSVPGIKGNADLNVAFTDIRSLKITENGVERKFSAK